MRKPGLSRTMKRRWLLLAVVVPACGGDGPAVEESPCEVQVVASGLTSPYAIMRDGDNYLLSVDGAVVRVTRDGQVSRMASVSPKSFGGLTRIEGDVAVLDNRLGQLIRFDGSWQGRPFASGLGNAVNVVPDGDGFVVTDFDNHVQGATTGRLLRVQPDGQVVVVASAGLGGTSGLLVEGDHYLLTDFHGGRLLRVSRSGEVRTAFQGLGNPVDVRRHGDHYYVTDYAFMSSGGRVMRLPASLTEPPSDLRTPSLGSVGGLLIDGRDILVTDVTGGRVLRLVACVR